MLERISKYLKHRPLLRRWLLFGLIIILLTGIGMISSAFFLVHELYTKEKDLQEKLVREKASGVESVCEEVVLGAQTFISNSMIKVTAKRHDETVEDRMRISELSKLMDEYSAIHKTFGKMFLFFPGGRPSALTMGEFIYLDKGIHVISGLDIDADINKKLFEDELYSKFKIVGAKDDKQLYYSMSTQYADSFDNQEAVLLIKLDKNEIRCILNDVQKVYLVADDGDYISFGDEEYSDEFISKCFSSDGQSIIDKKLVYSYEIGKYGLRFVAVNDIETARASIQPFIIGVIVYGFGLLLLIGIALTHMMRAQYRPIESLIEFMEDHDMGENSGQNDEFQRIESWISNTINNLEVSENEFRKFKSDNETRLIKLLNYGVDTIEDNNEENRYLVISYDIDNPTDKPMEQKERDQIWFIIHNVSEELIGKEHLLITGGLAHWFYNIVMLTGENDISFSELTEKLNTVCSFIREKFDIALVANVSDIHHGINSIPAANRESMIVREYRIYVGALKNVAFYKELSLDDDGKATLTSWDQMEQIQNMYRMHRGIEAQSMLDEIVNAAVESSKDINNNEVLEHESNGKTIQLVEKAREYVDKQFSDKDMNVNSVANELNVNNSYLSRTFKQVYGIGMLEYINNVRLENAEALMEKGCTVKDAADKVGFTTPRPLIRCFREKHGTTPGDYYKSK